MTRTPGRPRRSILSSVQRQLQLIVLGHIWTLAPLAAVWFLVPGWRGANPPAVTLSLVLVTEAALIAARHGLGPTGESNPSSGTR